MKEKEVLTEAEIYRQRNTLVRIQTLLDVIFGLMIFGEVQILRYTKLNKP